MASCRNCGIGVGCECNLTDGLCRRCNTASKTDITISVKKECTQTMNQLLTLKASLINRKPRTPIISYQLSIINSQIAQFVTNPCKFENIIKNIS